MLLREHVVDWLSGFWDITRIILAEKSGERVAAIWLCITSAMLWRSPRARVSEAWRKRSLDSLEMSKGTTEWECNRGCNPASTTIIGSSEWRSDHLY
jgi:hypothetical protein